MNQERLTKPYTRSLSDLAPDPAAIRSAYALTNPSQTYINYTTPHIGAKLQIITPEWDTINLTIDSPLTPKPKRNQEDQQIGTQLNANHHVWGAAAAYATLAQQEHQKELIRNLLDNPDYLTRITTDPDEIQQRIRENQTIRRFQESTGDQLPLILPEYLTQLSQNNASTFNTLAFHTTKDGRNLPFDFANDTESAIHIKTLLHMYQINDEEWKPYAGRRNQAKTYFALGNLAIAHLALNTIENKHGNKQLSAKEWKETLAAAEYILDWGYKNLLPYIQTQLAQKSNWKKTPGRHTIITARPREINTIIREWLETKATPAEKAKAHWFLSLTGMTLLSDTDPNRIVSLQALRTSVNNAIQLLKLRSRYNTPQALARLAHLTFSTVIGDAGHSNIYTNVFRTYNAYYESRRRQAPHPLDIGARPASMDRSHIEQIINDFNTQGTDRLRELSRREGLFGLTGKMNYLYIYDRNPNNQVAPIQYERYTQDLSRGMLVLEMDDLIKQARTANIGTLAQAAQKHLNRIVAIMEAELPSPFDIDTPKLFNPDRTAIQKSLEESLQRIKTAAEDGILTPIELGELKVHIDRLHNYARIIEKSEPNNPFVKFIKRFKDTFDRIENISDAITTITPTTIANTRFQAYWYSLDPKALSTIASLIVAPYGFYKLFLSPDNNIFTAAKAEIDATRSLGLLIPTDASTGSPTKQFQQTVLRQLAYYASELGDAADFTITMWTFDPVSLLIYRQFYGGDVATVSPYFLHGLYGENFLQQYLSSWMTTAETMGLSRETGAFIAQMLLSIMDPATIGSMALDAIATRGMATLGRAATKLPRLAKAISRFGSIPSKLTHIAPIARTNEGLGYLTPKSLRQAALIQMTTNAIRGSLRWASKTIRLLGDGGDFADAALMNGDPTTMLTAIAFSPEYFLSKQNARLLLAPFEVPIQTISTISKQIQKNRNLTRQEAASYIEQLSEYSAQALESPFNLISAGKQALIYDTQNGWMLGTITGNTESTITVQTPNGTVYQDIPLSHTLIAIPTALRENPTFAKNSTGAIALGILQGIDEKSSHNIPITLSVIETAAGKQATQDAIEALAAQGYITIEPNTGTLALTDKGKTLATTLKNPSIDAIVPILQAAATQLFDNPAQQHNFIHHTIHTLSQMDEPTRQALIRNTMTNLFDRFYKKATTHAIGMKTLMRGKLNIQTTQGFKKTRTETKTIDDQTEITLVYTTDTPLPSNKPYIVINNITFDPQTNPESLNIVQAILEAALGTQVELAGTKTNTDGTLSLAFQPQNETTNLTNPNLQKQLQEKLNALKTNFLQPLQKEIQETGISNPETLALYAALQATINPIVDQLIQTSDQTVRQLTPEEINALSLIQQTTIPQSPIQALTEAVQKSQEQQYQRDIINKQKQIDQLKETIAQLQQRIQEIEELKPYLEKAEQMKPDRRTAQWLEKQQPTWYQKAKEAKRKVPLLTSLQEELNAYQEMLEKDERTLKTTLLSFLDNEPIDHTLNRFFGENGLGYYVAMSLPAGHKVQYHWMAKTLGQITGAEGFRQILLGVPIGALRDAYKTAYQQALTKAIIRLMPTPNITEISNQITQEINRWKTPPSTVIRRIISDAAQGKHNEAILTSPQALQDALLQAGIIAESLPENANLLDLVRIYYNATQEEIGIDAANLFLTQIANAIALAHAHANAITQLTTLTEAETHNLWIATNTALVSAILSMERQLSQSPIGAKTTSTTTKTIISYKDALRELDDIPAEKLWNIPTVQESITQAALRDLSMETKIRQITDNQIPTAFQQAITIKKNRFKTATHDWLEFHHQTLTKGYETAYALFKQTSTYQQLLHYFTLRYGAEAEQELSRYLQATYRLNTGDISNLTTDRTIIRNNTQTLIESPELLYALQVPNLYFAITTPQPIGEQSIAPRITFIGSSLWNYTTLAEETLHALAIAIQNRVNQNIYNGLTQTIQPTDDPRAKLIQTPDMATLVGYYALTYDTQRKQNERSHNLLYMPKSPEEAEETIIDALQLRHLSNLYNINNPAIRAATRAMIGAEALRWKLAETIRQTPDNAQTLLDDIETFSLNIAAPRILTTAAGTALALKLHEENLLEQLAYEKLNPLPTRTPWLQIDLPPLPAQLQHLIPSPSERSQPTTGARFSSIPDPQKTLIPEKRKQKREELQRITKIIRHVEEPEKLFQILNTIKDDYQLASILNYITYHSHNTKDRDATKTANAQTIYILTKRNAAPQAMILTKIPITPITSPTLESHPIEFALPIINTNGQPTGTFAYYTGYKSGRHTFINPPETIDKDTLKTIIRNRITPEAYKHLIGKTVIHNGQISIVLSAEPTDNPDNPKLYIKPMIPIEPEISQELKSLFDYRPSKREETDIANSKRITTIHTNLAQKNPAINSQTKEGIYLFQPEKDTNKAVLVIDPIRLALTADDTQALVHNNAADRAIAINELLKATGYQTRALRKQNGSTRYTLPSDNDLKSQVTQMYDTHSKEETLEILKAMKSHLDMLIQYQPQNPALEIRSDFIIQLQQTEQIALIRRYQIIRKRIKDAIEAVKQLPDETKIHITDTIRIASRDTYAPLKDQYISRTEYDLLPKTTAELITLLEDYEKRSKTEGTPQSHFHMGPRFRLTAVSESTTWRIIQLLKELLQISDLPTSTEPMEILIKDMDIRYQHYPLTALPIAELRANMRNKPENRDKYRETIKQAATQLLTDLRRKGVLDNTTQTLEDNILEAILHAILSSKPQVLHQHLLLTENIRAITADPTEQSIEAIVISVGDTPIAVAVQYSTSSRSSTDRTLAQPHLIPIPSTLNHLKTAAANARARVTKAVPLQEVEVLSSIAKPLIGFYGLDPEGQDIPRLSTAHGTSIHLPTIYIHSMLRNLMLPIPINPKAITQHTIALGTSISFQTAQQLAITLLDTLATELSSQNIATNQTQYLQLISQKIRMADNATQIGNIERELTDLLLSIEHSQDIIRDQTRRKEFYNALTNSIRTMLSYVPLDQHTIAAVQHIEAATIDETTKAVEQDLESQANPPDEPHQPYETPAMSAALQEHTISTAIHRNAQQVATELNQTARPTSGTISYTPDTTPDITSALQAQTEESIIRTKTIQAITAALIKTTEIETVYTQLLDTLINNTAQPTSIEPTIQDAITTIHQIVTTSLRFNIPALNQAPNPQQVTPETLQQYVQETVRITNTALGILENTRQNEQTAQILETIKSKIGRLLTFSTALASENGKAKIEALIRDQDIIKINGVINIQRDLLINAQIMLALAAINRLEATDIITTSADISRASSAMGYGKPDRIISDYSIHEVYKRSSPQMLIVERNPEALQAQQIPKPASELEPNIPPEYIHAVLPIGSPIDRTIIPTPETNTAPPLVYQPSTTNPYALGVGLAENLTHTVGMLASQLWRLASTDPNERIIRYETDDISIEGNIEDIIIFLLTGVPYELESARKTPHIRAAYKLKPPDPNNTETYYKHLEEALILLYELFSQPNDNPVHVPHGILGKLPTDTSLDKNNPAELGYLGASVDIIRKIDTKETKDLETLSLRIPIIKKESTNPNDPLRESYSIEPLSTSIHRLADQHQKTRTAIAAALYIVFAQAADTLTTHMLTMQRGMKDAITTYIADLAFQPNQKTRIAALYDYLEATTPHMQYALYGPAIEAAYTIRQNITATLEKKTQEEKERLTQTTTELSEEERAALQKEVNRTIYSTGRIARLNTYRNQAPTDTDTIIIDPRSTSPNHYTGFRSKRTSTQSAILLAQTRGENTQLHPERIGQENKAIGAITARTRGFLTTRDNRWEALDGMPAPLMESETRLTLALAHTLQIISLFGENNTHITSIKGEIARTALIRHGFLLQSITRPTEQSQQSQADRKRTPPDNAAQLTIPQQMTAHLINTHITTNFSGETGISAIPPKASSIKTATRGIPELPTIQPDSQPITRNITREKLLLANRAIAYGLADLPRIFQDIENTITARRRGEETPKLPNIFDLFEASNGLGAQYTYKQTHPGGRRTGNLLFASWMTTAFGIPGITLLAQLSRFKIAQDPGFAVTLMATGGIVFLTAFATYYGLFKHMKPNPFHAAFETLRHLYNNTLGLTLDLILKDKRKTALQTIQHKWDRLVNRFLAASMTVCYTAHLAAKIHTRAIRELRKRRHNETYLGILRNIARRKGTEHNIDSYKETISELEEIYRLMGFEPTSATWIIGDILGTATTFGFKQQLPENITKTNEEDTLERILSTKTKTQLETLKDKIRKYEPAAKSILPIKTEAEDPAIDLLSEIHNTIALLAELTYFTTKETVTSSVFTTQDNGTQTSYNLSSRRNDYAIATIYLNLLMDYLTNKRVTYTNTQLMMDLINIGKEIVRDLESFMPGTETPLYEALIKAISIKNALDNYPADLSGINTDELKPAYDAMEYMYTRTELIDSLGYANYAALDQEMPSELNLHDRTAWYDLTFTRHHQERTSLARNLRSLPVGLVVLRNRKRYKEVDYIEGYSRAFALHTATYDNNPYSIGIARAVLIQTLLLGKEASRLADKIGAHIQRGYSMDTLASILAQQAAIAPPRIPKPKDTLLGTILHDFMMGISGITALANTALMLPLKITDLLRGKELIRHRARINAFHIASELASKAVLAAALGGNLMLIHTLFTTDHGTILSYLFNNIAFASLLGSAYAATSIKAARQTIPVMSNIFQLARNFIAKQVTRKDVMPAIGKTMIAEAIINHDLKTLQEYTQIQPSEKTATEIEKQATHTIENNALDAINATTTDIANHPSIQTHLGDNPNAPVNPNITFTEAIETATRTHRSLQANLSRVTARLELPKELAQNQTIQQLLLNSEQKERMENTLKEAIIAALKQYYNLDDSENELSIYIEPQDTTDIRYQNERIKILDLNDVSVKIIETQRDNQTERITIEITIPNIDEQQIAHQIAEIVLTHHLTSPEIAPETRPTFKIGLNKEDYENGRIKPESALRIARDAVALKQQLTNEQAPHIESAIKRISRLVESQLAEIAARTATDAATLAILSYQYDQPETPMDDMPLKKAHLAINKRAATPETSNLAKLLIAQLLPILGRELAISMENSINKQTHVIRTTTPAIGLDITISTSDKRHLTPEAAILLDAIAASQATTTTQTIEAIKQHTGHEYTHNTRDYRTTLNTTKQQIKNAVQRMKQLQPARDPQADTIEAITSRLSPYTNLIQEITKPRPNTPSREETEQINTAVEEALLTMIGIGQTTDLNDLIAILDGYRLGNLSLGDAISAMTREGSSQAFIRRLVAILTIAQPERNTPSGYLFDNTGTLTEITPTRQQTDTESAQAITESLQKVVLTLIESPQSARIITPLNTENDYLNYMKNIQNTYQAIDKIISEIEWQIKRIYPNPQDANRTSRQAQELISQSKTIAALRTLKDALGYIADATYRSYTIYKLYQKRNRGETLTPNDLLDHYLSAMILRADTEHALHRIGAYNQILSEAAQDDTEIIIIQAVNESLPAVPQPTNNNEQIVKNIQDNIFKNLYIGMLQHFARRIKTIASEDIEPIIQYNPETGTETVIGGIQPQSRLPFTIPLFEERNQRETTQKERLFQTATRNAHLIATRPILTIENIQVEPMPPATQEDDPNAAIRSADIIRNHKEYQTMRSNILGAMEDALLSSDQLPHSALAILAFDTIRAYAGHQPGTLDTIASIQSNTPVTHLMNAILDNSIAPDDPTRTQEMNLLIRDMSHTQRTLSILLRLVTIVLPHRAKLLSGTVNKLFTAASMAPNYAQALLVNLFGAGYIALDTLIRTLRKAKGYYGKREINNALIEAVLRNQPAKSLRAVTGYIPRRGRWLLNTLTLASLLAVGLLGYTLTKPNSAIPITNTHMLYYDLKPNSPFVGSLHLYSTDTGRSYKISISPIVDTLARVISPIYQTMREPEYAGITTDTPQALAYATGDTMIRIAESSMGGPTLPIRITENLLRHSFGTTYRSPFGNTDPHFYRATMTNDPILRQAMSILGEFTNTPQAILPEQLFRSIELNNPEIRSYSDLTRVEITPNETLESLTIASLASIGFPTFAQNTPYAQPFGLNNPTLELGHHKAIQPSHQDTQWTIRALAGTRDSTSALLTTPQGYYDPRTGTASFQPNPGNVDTAVKLGALRQNPILLAPYNLATLNQRQQAKQRQQNPARTFTEILLETSYRTHAHTTQHTIPTDPELPYILIQDQFGTLNTLEEQRAAQTAYNLLETVLYANLTGRADTHAHAIRMLGAALLGTTSITDPLYHHETLLTLTQATQPFYAEATPDKREHLINLLINIPSPYDTLQVTAEPTISEEELPNKLIEGIIKTITDKNTYKQYTAYRIEIDNQPRILIPFEARTTLSQQGTVGALSTPKPTTRTYNGFIIIDPATQNATVYAQPNNADTNKTIQAIFNLNNTTQPLHSEEAFTQTAGSIDTIFATVANDLLIHAFREATPTTLALVANLPSNATLTQTQKLRAHINNEQPNTALPTMVEILDATRANTHFKFNLIEKVAFPQKEYTTEDVSKYINALIQHYQNNKPQGDSIIDRITRAKLDKTIERLQTLSKDAKAKQNIANIANKIRQLAKEQMTTQFDAVNLQEFDRQLWNAALWSALQGYISTRDHWQIAFIRNNGSITTRAVYSPPGSLPMSIINTQSRVAPDKTLHELKTLMKRAMTTMSGNYAPYQETTQNP